MPTPACSPPPVACVLPEGLPPVRAMADSVLVYVPERQVSSLLLKGGERLYFDPSWAEMENKNLRGVVLSPPAALTRSYLLQRHKAGGKDRPHWGHAYTDQIADTLQAGDILYTDTLVSEPTFELPGLGADGSGNGGVYFCHVRHIVAVVRDGLILPYGSYCLFEPVYPPDVMPVTIEGHTLHLRMSASGLALGTENVPPLPYQGRLTHVGLPLTGQPQRVQVGQMVVLNKRFTGHGGLPLRLTIEGRPLYCIRQDYIEAILAEPEPIF